MFKQIKLEKFANSPHAIINKPLSYFENNYGIKFTEDHDDLDQNYYAFLEINNYLKCLLMRYRGFPEGTLQIYLDFNMEKIEDIHLAIKIILSEFGLEESDFGWKRQEDNGY